jgi:high-affinity iron transporter
MLQALVVTLREGVEAALVIGIAIAYLNKSGRAPLVRTVYSALAAAVLASIAGAMLFKRISINQDAVEGWILLLAALFVMTMIFWMQRTAHTFRRGIEEHLEKISSRQGASSTGVFFFVFLMVFREGVETVLMLSAVSLNSTDLVNFFGALAGLGLAVVFGVIFVRGTVRLNLRRFFNVTSAILLCVVLQLVITGLHELSESHVLPSSRREMALVGPIVSNSAFFFVTILALAALMVLFDWRTRHAQTGRPAASHGAPPLTPSPEVISSSVSLSNAARRKQLWEFRKERLWTAAVCVSSFVFVLLVTAEYIYAKNETALSPALQVSAGQGLVRIAAETVSDGNIHRFVYSAGDVTTRFIVVRVGERLATALDACEICGAQGYYQKGNSILCKNCGSAVYGPTIGVAGGCNPVPLPSSVEGSDLLIRTADLESGSKLFRVHE